MATPDRILVVHGDFREAEVPLSLYVRRKHDFDEIRVS
jgi:hypothetical protein